MKFKYIMLVACAAILGALIYVRMPPAAPVDDGNYDTAFMEDTPEGYAELGLKEGQPEPWEDGLRTNGAEGSFEWWYVDTQFEDGTTAAIVYFAKNYYEIGGPAHPHASLDVEFPDGTKRRWIYYLEEGRLIDASRDKADVKIGESYLREVDGNYEARFKHDDVDFTITMERTLPMWRPDTGHMYFDKDKSKYFAWIVAVPASKVTGTLKVGDKTQDLVGNGYHDHNWGNTFMPDVVNHWYWGRAQVGDYNLINVQVITREESGYTRVPVFMIAKDGVILSDDQNLTQFARADTIQHDYTGKFYDNHLTYVQPDPDGTTYTVEFIRDRDVLSRRHADTLGFFKRSVAKLIGVNSTYVRTVGEVRVTVEKDGQKEVASEEGIWEQMHFHKNRDAYIWN